MSHNHATPVYFGPASKGILRDHVKMCTTAQVTTSRKGHWSQEYVKIAKIPNR
jgi:hypothetical protein